MPGNLKDPQRFADPASAGVNRVDRTRALPMVDPHFVQREHGFTHLLDQDPPADPDSGVSVEGPGAKKKIAVKPQNLSRTLPYYVQRERPVEGTTTRRK
jgi:hypothetical protein